MKRLAPLVAGACAATALAAAQPSTARADFCSDLPLVFAGDPCDPAAGPYPMMPGLPLVLPADGARGSWRDGNAQVNTAFAGDVDLEVRVGSFPVQNTIPPPAGSPGKPVLSQRVAGGGGSAQGGSVPFTVFVTDGPGVFTYGAPIAGLDARPVAVFAFADLDGDGVVGPSDSDGSADNELEKQEALGQIGRQVGQIEIDRFANSVAVRVGAPASIGGLRVSLVAGMYTGDDPARLWSNGTPILTNWPFFPPLDPIKIVFLDEPNPPDSNGPNILFYDTGEFFLPDPSTQDLEDAFALDNGGSNPSTDQFVSISGPVAGARLFRDADAGTFRAASRLTARPAPSKSGVGRNLVLPADLAAVTAGEFLELRVLPVDSLGNIADPTGSGLPVRIGAEGGLEIVAPDLDGDPHAETVTIDSAVGVTVEVATEGAGGEARLTIFDPPPAIPSGYDQAVVRVRTGGDIDTDDDGILDDGDDSGTVSDRPCSASDVVNQVACDDNCPTVVNPAQSDSDEDGQGNCCDGTCVLDDGQSGCLECPQALTRFSATAAKSKIAIQPRAGLEEDGVQLRSRLRPQDGQEIDPEAESVEFSVASGDRLHYFAQLPGLFVPVAAGTWTYEDPSGSVAGILKAQIVAKKKGIRVRLTARGLNLVDTAPAEDLTAGLVLAVTVGNDAFTRHLKCTSSPSLARCRSVD